MTDIEPYLAAEAEAALRNELIRDRVRQGDTPEAIQALLVDRGLGEAEARELVAARYDEAARDVESEALTPRTLALAGAGGLVAAVVGGVLWAWLVRATDSEIGIAAVGIGVLAGFGVLLFARGGRGVPLQVIAVAAAVLGIAIGKYLTYVDAVKAAVEANFGAEAVSQVKTFSTDTVRYFFEDLDVVLSGYDVIWVALAVIAAWRVPRDLAGRFGTTGI